MISRSFQTIRRMREAWKWETYVRSQSFSSESAVKYLHVGRRKIQISPPLGEQDQSNALPQDQQRQSNPHPMPCLAPTPPHRHDIDRCIKLISAIKMPKYSLKQQNCTIMFGIQLMPEKLGKVFQVLMLCPQKNLVTVCLRR